MNDAEIDGLVDRELYTGFYCHKRSHFYDDVTGV